MTFKEPENGSVPTYPCANQPRAPLDMPKANHVCTSLFSDIVALSGVALNLMLGTWLAFGMSTAKSIHLTA